MVVPVAGHGVFLTGFMAAGKTAVGKALGAELGYPFVDLDREIETMAGISVANIFSRRGEGAFRDLEHDCLRRIATGEPLVVALGGGAFTFGRNRDLIGVGGVSFWLDPPFEVLLERCAHDTGSERPLFRDGESARRLYLERKPAYALADHRIGIGERESIPSVTARILAILRESL